MRKSFGDMVRSLGLMAVIVAVVLVIGGRYLIAPGDAAHPAPADYSSALQDFPRVAGAPVLAPHGLPTSWRANAARLLTPAPGAAQLHIGWAVPRSRYAGLDEATGAPPALFASVLGTATPQVLGTTDIAGATWQLRRASNGEEALTRQAGKVTVVLTGDASDAQLRMLASSLR